jgi:hypothetical protein
MGGLLEEEECWDASSRLLFYTSNLDDTDSWWTAVCSK